jgi:hypothetical protein
MDLKACKVYNGVDDYINDEDRESFLYSEKDIDLLSSYGFIISYELEPLYIEDSLRYSKRVR